MNKTDFLGVDEFPFVTFDSELLPEMFKKKMLLVYSFITFCNSLACKIFLYNLLK